MAISQRLKDIVALALKDATITPREKEIIINEATKDNIGQDEITDYLQAQLSEAISHKDKYQLKSCPNCGAHIPLISEYCPYCDYQYKNNETEDSKLIDYGIQLAIEIENKDTGKKHDAELDKQTTCIKCGAQRKSISNVCPHCGNIYYYSKSDNRNIQNFLDKTCEAMTKFFNIKKISLGNVVKFRIIHSLSLLLVIPLSIIHPVLGIAALILWYLIPSPTEKYLEARQEAESEIDKALRMMKFFYEDDSEARKLISEYRNQIKQENTRRNTTAYYVATIIILAAVVIGIWVYYYNLFIEKGGHYAF